MEKKLNFASDYMKGAHPAILERLAQTNMMETPGYGHDPFSESARRKIREACGCPRAEVEFLVGGTQTNATVIDALLRPWQGVVAAQTGHIATHEAGAIEAGGHKVLTLPHTNGKLDSAVVRACLADASQSYSTIIVAWDDAVGSQAVQEKEEQREAARKTAAERRGKRVSAAADAF